MSVPRRSVPSRRSGRTNAVSPTRPSILAYQTAISVLLILAGVFVNKVNLSVLKPVKASMTQVLTENYGLSAVSMAVEEFLQSAGISTDGIPIFDWLKKVGEADKAEKAEDTAPENGTPADTPQDGSTDNSAAPREPSEVQPTSGTPQGDAEAEDENEDTDAGHKYSIAATKDNAPVKPMNLTYQEEEPAIPANVLMNRISLGVTFSAPVKGTVTSAFGYRIHPTLKKVYFHYGTDIGAEKGTPILASAAGTVEETGTDKAYGKYIIIRHSKTVSTFYGHCSTVSVKKGTKVKAGKKIGEVGSTGIATGSHLHFEIRYGEKYVDPQKYAV